MTTERFVLSPRIYPSALANGYVGDKIWPETPPPADPVSGGALKLWQFGGGPYSRTEIYQSAHVQLTYAGTQPDFGYKNYLIQSNAGSQNGGLVGPNEAASQVNIICVKNVDPGGNQMLMNTTTSTAAEGGFQLRRDTGSSTIIKLQSRGILNASGGNGVDQFDVAAVGSTLFLILAVVHTATTRLLYIHGVNSAARTGVAYVAPTVARGVGFGNTFSATWNRSPVISAAAQLDSAPNLANVTALCTWLAQQERYRGVSVYGP